MLLSGNICPQFPSTTNDTKRVDGQWRAAGENGMPLVVTGKTE